MRAYVSYSLVGIFGVVVGTVIPTTTPSSEPPTFNTSSNNLKITQLSTIETSANSPFQLLNTEEVPELSFNEILQTLQAASSTANDIVIQEELTTITGTNQHSLLNIITGTTIDELSSASADHIIAEFNTWMAANGDSAQQIVALFLSDLDIEQQQAFEYLIASGSAQGDFPNLAENLVAELATANHKDASKWKTLLRLVQMDSPIARSDLLTTLPALTDSSIVSASIQALQPDIVAPDERNMIISELSSYAKSDSPIVRASATSALVSWGATDYTFIIEGALEGNNSDELRSTLRAVSLGGMWSPSIQTNVINILNNTSLNMDLRYAAFSALSTHALAGTDYESYYRFYNEHVR